MMDVVHVRLGISLNCGPSIQQAVDRAEVAGAQEV